MRITPKQGYLDEDRPSLGALVRPVGTLARSTRPGARAGMTSGTVPSVGMRTMVGERVLRRPGAGTGMGPSSCALRAIPYGRSDLSPSTVSDGGNRRMLDSRAVRVGE